MGVKSLTTVPNKNKYQKWASGSATANAGIVAVSGLSFRPARVILWVPSLLPPTGVEFYILSDLADLYYKGTNGPIFRAFDDGTTPAVQNRDVMGFGENKIQSDGFAALNVIYSTSSYKWFAWK